MTLHLSPRWWNEAKNNFCPVLLGRADKLSTMFLKNPGSSGIFPHSLSLFFQIWVLQSSLSYMGPFRPLPEQQGNHICLWIKVRCSSWAMRSPKSKHQGRFKTSEQSHTHAHSKSLSHGVKSLINTFYWHHQSNSSNCDKKCPPLRFS